MAEKIAFENGRIFGFKGQARDLDLGSGHTAYYRVSLIDLYVYTPNFIKIEESLCGRTGVHTDGRTSPSSKPRDTKTRTNIRNAARSNLYIVTQFRNQWLVAWSHCKWRRR